MNLTNEDLNNQIAELKTDVAVIKSSIDGLVKQIDLRFSSSQIALAEALSTQKEATKILADSNEKHFTFLNGEAQRLIQMQDTYIPREVHDSQIAALRKDIQELRDWKNTALGRQSVISVVVAAVISIIVGVVIYTITRV